MITYHIKLFSKYIAKESNITELLQYIQNVVIIFLPIVLFAVEHVCILL